MKMCRWQEEKAGLPRAAETLQWARGTKGREVHLSAVRSQREDGCLFYSGKRQLTRWSPIVSGEMSVNTATALFTLDF